MAVDKNTIMVAGQPAVALDDTSRQAFNPWAWRIGLGIAVPMLGLLLRSDETGAVALAFLPDHPLPTICVVRRYLGVDCFACGLTRSVMLLLQCRWEESIATHPLGWLVFILITVQIPYGIQLRMRGNPWRPSMRSRAVFWIGLFALFVFVRVLPS